MPRQKSAPKRSGIDLGGFLLNRNDENTNAPLGRGGEGGEVKKNNHEFAGGGKKCDENANGNNEL